MSRPERRRELQEQFDREYAAQQREEARKMSLSLWQRIEEVASIEDVKDVLHRLAQGEREV